MRPFATKKENWKMNKKVLLLMAIQKELNIKFPLDEVVQIKDTKKLTSVVYRQLNGKMAD